MGELLSYLCPFHGVIIFLICAKLMALLLQLCITTLALALFVHLSPRLSSQLLRLSFWLVCVVFVFRILEVFPLYNLKHS